MLFYLTEPQSKIENFVFCEYSVNECNEFFFPKCNEGSICRPHYNVFRHKQDIYEFDLHFTAYHTSIKHITFCIDYKHWCAIRLTRIRS